MSFVILILGILFIFKDEIKQYIPKKQEVVKEEDVEKQKKLQEDFDKLMNYTIEKAIESKRGDK